MISAIAADQPIANGAQMAEYRYRSSRGERSLLPDSTPAPPQNPRTGSNGEFGRQERPAAAQPEPPNRDSSSMFAAAVISGALPPTPQTMEELMLRIGISPIPEESQARLKDLLA